MTEGIRPWGARTSRQNHILDQLSALRASAAGSGPGGRFVVRCGLSASMFTWQEMQKSGKHLFLQFNCSRKFWHLAVFLSARF